jgi:hypothetical protein
MMVTNVQESPETKTYFACGRAPNGFGTRVPKFNDTPPVPEDLPRKSADLVDQINTLQDKVDKLEGKKEPLRASIKEIEDKQAPMLLELRDMGKQLFAAAVAHLKLGEVSEFFLCFKAAARMFIFDRKVVQDINTEALNTATLEMLYKEDKKMQARVVLFQEKWRAQQPSKIVNTFVSNTPAKTGK